MTSDDRVIAALSDANPVARTVAPGPRERAEADRVLRQVMSAPPRTRHRRRCWFRPSAHWWC